MTLRISIRGLHQPVLLFEVFLVNKGCMSSLNRRPRLASTRQYTNNDFQGQRKIPPTSIWFVRGTNLASWLGVRTSIQWRIRNFKGGITTPGRNVGKRLCILSSVFSLCCLAVCLQSYQGFQKQLLTVPSVFKAVKNKSPRDTGS